MAGGATTVHLPLRVDVRLTQLQIAFLLRVLIHPPTQAEPPLLLSALAYAIAGVAATRLPKHEAPHDKAGNSFICSVFIQLSKKLTLPQIDRL